MFFFYQAILTLILLISPYIRQFRQSYPRGTGCHDLAWKMLTGEIGDEAERFMA